MRNNTDALGKENITRLIFQYSLPATVGMVVAATYNIADTIFIGRLGSEAIAALSIAFPIQMILAAIGVGVGVGAASLISRSLGAGDVGTAEKTVGQVISLALIFGLLIAVLGMLYLQPFLMMIGARGEVLGYTEDYASVVTAGSLFFFLIMGLNNVVRAEGSPILSMQVMIGSSLLNIALDPIFIFTLGLEVQGAAVATLLAKAAGTLFLLAHFINGHSNLTLRRESLKPDGIIIKEIARIGLTSMLRLLAKNLSLTVTNMVLAGFGHIPIAAMGLYFRLQSLIIMPVIGLAQGLLPVIGYNYGANKKERIREAVIKGFTISTAFITVLALINFLIPTTLLGIFTSDPELLSLGSYALRIMIIMFPLIGIQLIVSIFFQAIGKALPALFLSLLREVMVFIPLLLLFSGYFGLDGVWFARPVSDLLAFIITMVMIVRELKNQGIPLIKRGLNDKQSAAYSNSGITTWQKSGNLRE